MGLIREKGAPPLYFQVETIIKEQIENDEFLYGEVLPSEKQLQELYGVSRVTIRQAISSLVNTGYLLCSRGIGTTVVFEKIDENINRVISFSEEMEQHGIKMETSYCVINLQRSNKIIASNLNIKEGEESYKLVRVRCAKDMPMVYSITYLKKNYNLPLDPNVYMDSLYKLLDSEYGVKVVNGQDTFEATLSNQTIGGFLNIPLGSPIFKRTRKTFDRYNELVEYTICYYPGDKYKYTIEL
ncbi:MAG: GntR family transcriptional regulator [Anaerocolumna sp.]